MKLTHKMYTPNKKFIATFGNRFYKGDRAGDCVVRAFTKLTDLDYMTVASMVATANNYKDIRMINNGNYVDRFYNYYLKPRGYVRITFSHKGNLRNTAKLAVKGLLDYKVDGHYDNSFDPDVDGVSSLADRFVTWLVGGRYNAHMATTKNYTLYDSWDCAGSRVAGSAYVKTDGALADSFDWS